MKVGVACHSDLPALKTKITTLQADVTAKLATLEALLITANVYNPTTGLNNTGAFSGSMLLALT